MNQTAERKLTTILCADVAGYSAMMDRDEDATLATLKDYRGCMSGLISHHRGRVVNTAGDGLMAEFASPVEAVRCATEVQHELAGRNVGRPKDQQMNFRIGINLGDVMVDENDLFGEGVNIAARLESLADPGGILIASTVFDQVKTKLPVRFDYLGEQKVKNISEGIPTYRIFTGDQNKQNTDFEPDWSALGTDQDETEDLASYSRPEQEPQGKADEPEPPPPTAEKDGFGRLFEQLMGSSEEAEARDVAKRSGLVGLALAAISIVTPLNWVIWPGIALAFSGFQIAISKTSWSGKKKLRFRLLSIIALLFAINAAASFGNWWFIYPGIVLGILAFFTAERPSSPA